MTIYGYFSQSNTDIPELDPGLDVDCPVCHRKLERPVVTFSLMVPGDARCYFYRIHSQCEEVMSPELETEIDSILVDAIYRSRQTN